MSIHRLCAFALSLLLCGSLACSDKKGASVVPTGPIPLPKNGPKAAPGGPQPGNAGQPGDQGGSQPANAQY